MTDRELMQQTLGALEYADNNCFMDTHQQAITALRERLAQPEQEPTELLMWKSRALQAERLIEKFMQPEQEPVAHTLNCVCGAVWDISLNGAEEMVQTPDAPKPSREKVAAWMIQRGYATGHGDTTEDLLNELDWQIAERIAAEREKFVAFLRQMHDAYALASDPPRGDK